MKNKANVPRQFLVTEMLRVLCHAYAYEITHWVEQRFLEVGTAQETWTVLRLVFLKKPDAELEKGIRGLH